MPLACPTSKPLNPVGTGRLLPLPCATLLLPPRFHVIYADPPWRLGSGKGSPPYPMMATKDICPLPVQGIAATDCLLFLWAIHSHLPDALAVIHAWGFTYKTVAFTWVKRTPKDTGYFLGRGYWTHSNAEVCLLATRGHPRRVGTGVPSLIVSPRREHSRKPRRGAGANRPHFRRRAPCGAVRPAEGKRVECLGQRGRLRLRFLGRLYCNSRSTHTD